MVNTFPEQRRSWFLIFGLLAFGVSAALSVTLEFRTSSLKNQINTLTIQKNALLETPAEDKTGGAEAIAASILVKKELAQIETRQFPWSKIIEKIETTIPKTSAAKPIVEFRSYTGSEDGRISVSAVTLADSADPYLDISKLLEAFSTEPVFKKVFVPSLTKSLNSAGESVVSFSLNFEYHNLTLTP